MSSENCLHDDGQIDDGQSPKIEGDVKEVAHRASGLERVQLDAKTKRIQEELISLIQKFPLVFEAAFSMHPELCPSTIAPCFKDRAGKDLTDALAYRIRELGGPQDFIDLLHLAASLTPAELEGFFDSVSPDDATSMITEILAAKASMTPTLIALYHEWYACHWAGKEVSDKFIPPSTALFR